MDMRDFKMPALQTEDFFERFASASAFLLWDGRHVRIVRTNRDYITEIGPECMVEDGTDLLDTLDTDSRQAYLQAVEQAVQTGIEQQCEGWRRYGSTLGEPLEIYVQTRLKPIEETQDGYLLFAIVRNATEEKHRIRSTAGDDTRFCIAAEQTKLYTWEYDINTKQMRPCFRCMRDFGLPPLAENYPELAIEKGIIPPDYAEMYRDWHRRLEAGEKKLEGIIPLTSKRILFHVRYTATSGNDGKPIKAFGSATQVVSTDKEREYREIISCLSKAYFGLYLLDLTAGEFHQFGPPRLQAMVDTIGAEGRIDDAFMRTSKYLVEPESREEILHFTDWTTLADRLQDCDSIGIHFLGSHAGWCEGLFVVAQRDDQGRCTHVLWAVRSIQKEKEEEEEQKRQLAEAYKQLEGALEDAKRADSSRTAFLSRMSHDIRTPLNGIIGLLEINDRHSDDVELMRANRTKAKIAAAHLLALINDVLELTKMDDKNVQLVEEAFDITTLLNEVDTIADLRASENGITLKVTESLPAGQQPYVFGSPLHVKQMLLNIVGNAIKYNHPGGFVTCTATMQQEDAQTMRCVFCVADTGIGMSDEYLEHLFEPFSQEHADESSVYHGTGLGMAIVKSLVGKMNGQIDVQSEQGVGTTVTLSIPFRIAREEDLPGMEEVAAVDITGARILIVEDNPLNMEIAVTLLEEAGALITQANNGLDAVNLYAASAPDSFDLILMDLMMPVMGGLDATEKIREMDPPYCDIPIVAMTANAFAEDVKECLSRGMNGHLAKPLDLDKLLATIARYKHA